MMAPWNKQKYLERIWCIFEVYTANTTDDCKSEIIMPPREREAMLQAVIQGDDVNIIFEKRVEVLGNTKIELATASQEEDKINILQLVRETIGYSSFDTKVNVLLRKWVKDEILDEEKNIKTASNDLGKDRVYSFFCSRAAEIFLNLGHLEESLEYRLEVLSIEEKVLDVNSPDLAGTYGGIGMVLHTKGDLDEALKYVQKTLSIHVRVLDANSLDLAETYNKIASALQAKGYLDEALKYYEKNLSIREKVLHLNSPYLARTYNNIELAL